MKPIIVDHISENVDADNAIIIASAAS